MKQETSVNVKMPKKATRAVSVPAQRSKEMNLTLLSCRKKRFIQRGGKKITAETHCTIKFIQLCHRT